MKLNKLQQELLSRTAGRRYCISKFEGRREDLPWYDIPLRGNQLLPRSLSDFVKEQGKVYAVWLVHRTVNGTNCDCESMAPAPEVSHSPDFSTITMTGPHGRLTYKEIK